MPKVPASRANSAPCADSLVWETLAFHELSTGLGDSGDAVMALAASSALVIDGPMAGFPMLRMHVRRYNKKPDGVLYPSKYNGVALHIKELVWALEQPVLSGDRDATFSSYNVNVAAERVGRELRVVLRKTTKQATLTVVEWNTLLGHLNMLRFIHEQRQQLAAEASDNGATAHQDKALQVFARQVLAKGPARFNALVGTAIGAEKRLFRSIGRLLGVMGPALENTSELSATAMADPDTHAQYDDARGLAERVLFVELYAAWTPKSLPKLVN